MIKEIETAIDSVMDISDDHPELALSLAEELLESLNLLIDDYQADN